LAHHGIIVFMRRTLIQLDEATYGKLRQKAFQQERSISSVVREMVEAGLEGEVRRAKPKRVSQFLSVASGRSKRERHSPVSDRHDEALPAAFDKSSLSIPQQYKRGQIRPILTTPLRSGVSRRSSKQGEDLLTHNYVLVESMALLQARLGFAARLSWPETRKIS